MYLVVAEVVGDEFNFTRKLGWQRPLGSLLEFRYRLHKTARNVERRHADVDIEHDPSEGGAGGGVESLEGEKHSTEDLILAILLRRKKVSILPGTHRLSGGALLDNKVESGNKWLEIPLPLAQIAMTKSVQGGIGMALQAVGQHHSPGKLVRI